MSHLQVPRLQPPAAAGGDDAGVPRYAGFAVADDGESYQEMHRTTSLRMDHV